MILVTGITEDQMGSTLKTMEFCEEEGVKVPSDVSCYLCKRKGGANSVLLVPDDEDVLFREIELNAYEVVIGDEITYYYWLCDECMFLLQDFAEQTDTGDEELES
jgi:hypothetical protein